MKEYALKFTQLAKYAPTMGAESRARMSKFISGVSKIVVKEGRIAMLFRKIDISRLMKHTQQIEEEKHKERSGEVKRAKTSDGDFSYLQSDRDGRSRFRQRFSVKVLS